MIYSQETLALEEQAELLVQTILKTQAFQEYQTKKQALKENTVIQKQQMAFMREKEKFQALESYGEFTPGFQELRRKLRKEKRQLDLQPEVATFKQAETTLQGICDEVALAIAEVLSKEVKVDYGNPFFQTKKSQHHSCEGCHHHGV